MYVCEREEERAFRFISRPKPATSPVSVCPRSRFPAPILFIHNFTRIITTFLTAPPSLQTMVLLSCILLITHYLYHKLMTCPGLKRDTMTTALDLSWTEA
ncbi:hypothetical protein WMY93_031904 [Mugilogobius chulae]|uniref:Uncharacterized protein n=1 Tax=Mugilogobius chulae TaxID=88201 RepID=A0AAW0MCW1_9GOBI